MSDVKINITPLVDVCISLLIVFMVSGPLIIQPSLKIKVPEAITDEEKEETEKIIIYITADGKFAVDDLILKQEEVEIVLQKKIKLVTSRMVLIKADKNAKNGYLLDMMKIAKRAGANKVTIATTKQK
jgi:biopolymer transport protein ExbD